MFSFKRKDKKKKSNTVKLRSNSIVRSMEKTHPGTANIPREKSKQARQFAQEIVDKQRELRQQRRLDKDDES